MTLAIEVEQENAHEKNQKVVVMARHGERKDYVERDAGNNWILNAEKPWDPPLSQCGVQQSRQMGQAIQATLKRLGLPPVSQVYSSPLTRCRQTAAAAIDSFDDCDGGNEEDSLCVCVEDGLMESVNAAWYGSRALPGSDSTWGCRPLRKDGEGRLHVHEIDESTIHEAAKKPIQCLLEPSVLFERSTTNDEENGGDSLQLHAAVATNYKSRSQVPAPYCWNFFETRQQQRVRMKDTMELLARSNETILCVSHGGPVTHLYEEVTGNEWMQHGESSYTCISIYVQQEDGEREWTPLVVNDSSHLDAAVSS